MSYRIPEIPCMTASEEGGCAVWRNALTGMVLTRDPEGVRYVLEVPEWKTFDGRALAGRVEMYGSIKEAVSAFAYAWVEYVAIRMGLGFHNDTRCESYEPPLPPDLAAEYDEMCYVAFQVLDDPYEPGVVGWERAGYIEPDPEAVTPAP